MRADYWKMAVNNVRKRGLRSWLTMLGIFIGIAAIVSLISLAQGLEGAIQEQFEEIGADKLIIQPKGAFGPPGSSSSNPLRTADLEQVEDVRGIDEAAGILMGSGKMVVDDAAGFFVVAGLPTDADRKLVAEVNNYDIARGNNLRDGRTHKAVLGIDFNQEALVGEQTLDVRDRFQLNGVEFKVAGFWERIGNPTDDRSISIPKALYRDIFDKPDQEDMIVAKVAAGSEIRAVAERVERTLRQHRNLDEGDEDFVVQTPEDLLESFSTILQILQVSLVGIASISLLVGGIGITNTMFTSVLERTKEIGILKAVGARNADVMWLFLIESGLLGIVGGGIGTALGIGLAKLVESVAVTVFGITFVQAYSGAGLLVGAILFSFIVGIVSGALPARNAAQLQPVEAIQGG